MKQQIKPIVQADLDRFEHSLMYFDYTFSLGWGRSLAVHLSAGIRYLADETEMWWLIDHILAWQIEPQVKYDDALQRFQFWTLHRQDAVSSLLLCERDRDDVVVCQEIGAAYLPVDPLRVWFDRSNCVMMLPSEYPRWGTHAEKAKTFSKTLDRGI